MEWLLVLFVIIVNINWIFRVYKGPYGEYRKYRALSNFAEDKEEAVAFSKLADKTLIKVILPFIWLAIMDIFLLVMSSQD